jgi:hypothetical protein
MKEFIRGQSQLEVILLGQNESMYIAIECVLPCGARNTFPVNIVEDESANEDAEVLPRTRNCFISLRPEGHCEVGVLHDDETPASFGAELQYASLLSSGHHCCSQLNGAVMAFVEPMLARDAERQCTNT